MQSIVWHTSLSGTQIIVWHTNYCLLGGGGLLVAPFMVRAGILYSSQIGDCDANRWYFLCLLSEHCFSALVFTACGIYSSSGPSIQWDIMEAFFQMRIVSKDLVHL